MQRFLAFVFEQRDRLQGLQGLRGGREGGGVETRLGRMCKCQ